MSVILIFSRPTFQQTFRPIPAVFYIFFYSLIYIIIAILQRPRQRIVAQQPQSPFNRQNVFISRRRGQSNSFAAQRQNVFQQPQPAFGGGRMFLDLGYCRIFLNLQNALIVILKEDAVSGVSSVLHHPISNT